MEYNHPSEIVKDLAFGSSAKNKIMKGVTKLSAPVTNPDEGKTYNLWRFFL